MPKTSFDCILDNVHFMHMSQLVAALMRQETQFTQLVYVHEHLTRTHEILWKYMIFRGDVDVPG